jgi:nicotinamidase/pyrazinamidase
VQRKGENRDVDSYSAFRDNDQSALTGLSDYLKRAGIGTLDICGLATDYCVKASALDAKVLLPAVSVRFIADASRGIDAHGVEAAMKEMAAAGVRIMTSNDVFAGE